MIQNADDNTFLNGGTDPCLSIKYRENDEQHLSITCNEVGFTKENVNALCGIGRSTKRGTGNRTQTGYIGEKGIGFKSVFKVADIVSISSGSFSFKFNRDGILGMIVPEWIGLEGPSPPGTTVSLRIPDLNDRTAVKNSLMELEAEILLFLRKLAIIDVEIMPDAGSPPSYKYRLQLHRRVDRGYSTLTRIDDAPTKLEKKERIDIRTFTVENMPPEPKREGITTTAVALGFPDPLSSHHPRSTYNFLPIRTYGLLFLLQADFILTADRGNIDEGKEWNRRLVSESIPDAFVLSVVQFNESGPYKYEWPKFLGVPGNEASGTIMTGFRGKLLERLKNEHVLEDRDGNPTKPSSLVILPAHFTMGDSPPTPLLNRSSNRTKYASPEYDDRDLVTLGLTRETPEAFYTRLKLVLTWVQKRSLEWHVRLAVGIMQSRSEESFKDVSLIPLRNGTWACAKGLPIFLPGAGENVAVPDGIDVRIIDDKACASPERRRLFVSWGAQDISPARCCELIIKKHLTILGPPWTLDLLVSQAWYLFLHGHGNLRLAEVKLVSEELKLATSDELYMDLPIRSFRLKEYMSKPDAPCCFLHTGYLEKSPEGRRTSWHRWLQERVGVGVLPKLRDRSNLRSEMSTEFKHLVQSSPTHVWLTLLRDNWSSYHHDARDIKQQLGSLQVECKNSNGQIDLRDAYLATAAVMKEPLAKEHAPLVDVTDPNDDGWPQLRPWGPRTAQDTNLFLSILVSVSQRSASSVNQETLRRLYQGVEHYSKQSAQAARVTFGAYKLIQIPSVEPRWLSLAECRWQSPDCLKGFVALKPHFSKLRTFFVEHLEIKNAGPLEILGELLSLQKGTPDMISGLLLALSKHGKLDRPDIKNYLEMAAGRRLIPVRRNGDTQLRHAHDEDWFIPDRPRLKTCFEGKIWTIAFNAEQIHKLEHVIEKLELSKRRLSKHVVEETFKAGKEVLDKDLSVQIQAKAQYIGRLLPIDGRGLAVSRLEQIEVWSASTLRLDRYVYVSGGRIYGEAEEGRVLLKEERGLRLFCSTKSVTKHEVPWPFIRERLAEAFEIRPDMQCMLTDILTTSSSEVIEDILGSAGLMSEPTEATTQSDCSGGSEEDSDVETGDSPDLSAKPTEQPTSTGFHRRSYLNPQELNVGHTVTSRSSLKSESRSEADVAQEQHIVAAAGAWSVEKADIIGPIADDNSGRNNNFLVSTSRTRKSLNPDSLPPLDPIGGDTVDAGGFDMSAMSDALPITRSTGSQSLGLSPSTASPEQMIGFKGELFVYSILSKELEASYTCWTSNMRGLHNNLPSFSGNEKTHSDFTISERDTASRFTQWLEGKGISQAKDWLNRDMTYHLEVKTTTGKLLDPFMMSNNQMRLAQEWHEEPSHAYIILRVYQLYSDPDMVLYVDPFAMMEQRQLLCAAHGGYAVSAARLTSLSL